MTTEKRALESLAVSLWLDSASEPGTPSWIVSLDLLDASGSAATSDTLRVFDEDEYAEAAAYARTEAVRRGINVIEAQ